MLLVGYNKTHWFVKNSWGPAWADRGYAYILKANDCGLSQNVHVVNVTFNYTNLLPTSYIGDGITTLVVRLDDSNGDGWNGNVIGVRQNY